MIPFLKPQSRHISVTTARSRLSVEAPYWPCIRTLNISTAREACCDYTFLTGRLNAPGLARMALAAPAIAPAAAISFKERFGKGEIILLEVP